MKRKVFAMLFIGGMSLFLTACGDKKNESTNEPTEPTIICTSKLEADSISITNKLTVTLNDNKYAKVYVNETTIKANDEELFKSYEQSAKETKISEDDKNTEYTYNIDENNKTCTMTYKYNITDEVYNNFSESGRESISGKYIIESSEEGGASCELKNITREALGL